MSRLRYQAASALIDALLPAMPVGTVGKAVEQPPTQFSQYPEILALPQRFSFTWWYEEPLCDDNGDVVLDSDGRPMFFVGEEEGVLQLQAYARTAYAREAIEDAVTAAFNQLSGKPGVLVATIAAPVISGKTLPVSLTASFSLPTSEWRDELVFSERRREFIDVDATLGVYVPREIADNGENAIVQVIDLCLSEDITTDISVFSTPAEKLSALEPLDTMEVT